MGHPVALCFPLAVAFAGTLMGQDRRPLLGTVVDAAGAPVAGARVTLCVAVDGPDEPPDARIATTDARGRFAVSITPQRGGSLWARSADGRLASPVAEDVTPGRVHELRLTLPVQERKLTVLGDAAWAAAGPLRVETSPRAANPMWTPLGAEDRVPPGPPDLLVRVLDKDNQVIHRATLLDGARLELTIPAPQRWDVRLVDGAGKPLADGTVCHEVQPNDTGTALFARPASEWRRAGITDCNGDAAILLAPAPAGPPARLLVWAPGHAERIVQLDGRNQAWSNGENWQLERKDAVQVTLLPDATLVLNVDGQPAAPARASLAMAPCSGFPVRRDQTLVADRAGACVVRLPGNPIESMLSVQTRRDAPPSWTRIPPWHPGSDQEVDLAGQRDVRVQVSDENGNPTPGMPGVLMPVGSIFAVDLAVPIWCDAAGRFACRLGVDSWLLVFCDGVRFARFDVPRTGAVPAAGVVCTPMPTASVRVRGAGGVGLAGARLLADFQMPVFEPPKVPDAANLGLTLARAFNHRAIASGRLYSDDRGCIEARLLPVPLGAPQAWLRHGTAVHPVALHVGHEVAVDLPSRR